MSDKEKRRKRRAAKNRMKGKASKVYPWYEDAHKLADHIKNCSCYMCANRREYEGPTRKEREGWDSE